MTWDSLLFTKMVTNTGANASGRSIKQAAMIAMAALWFGCSLGVRRSVARDKFLAPVR
ncbi:hypothetical protein D3C86_2188530 [compost metagenome]